MKVGDIEVTVEREGSRFRLQAYLPNVSGVHTFTDAQGLRDMAAYLQQQADKQETS